MRRAFSSKNRRQCCLSNRVLWNILWNNKYIGDIALVDSQRFFVMSTRIFFHEPIFDVFSGIICLPLYFTCTSILVEIVWTVHSGNNFRVL